MARPRPAPAACCLAALLALAACGPPPEVVAARGAPASPDRPAPLLLPTETFDTALARAGADTERLAAGTTALEARAAALRARAADLEAPVLTPAESARLEAAATAPPQIPDP